METHELVVEQRVKTGKGSARKSRAKGHVPGVVYGKDIEPFSISFEPASLRTVLKSGHGKNSVMTLNVDGGRKVMVMLQDIQTHPLSRSIIHADFIHVFNDRTVDVDVPLHLDGRPVGVQAGGLLQSHARTLRLRSLPQDIPVEVRVDVTNMNIGDTMHIKDVVLPAGVEAVYKTNYLVATVVK